MEEEGKKGKKVSAHRRVLPRGRGVGWGSLREGGREGGRRSSGLGQWSGGPAARGGSAAPFRGRGVPFADRPGPAQTPCQGARLPRAPGWDRRGSGPSEGPGGGQDCAMTGDAFTAHLALFWDVQ